MRLRFLYLLAFLIPAAARADQLPCKLTNYCAFHIRAASGTATVYIVSNGVVSPAPIAMGTLSAQDVKFLVVDLDNSLQANTDYALKLKGTAGTAKVPFDDADFKFSTKPKATIAPPVEENVADYRYGEKLWVTSNVALDKSSENQVRFKSEDAPGVFVPHAAAVHIPDRTPDMGFARYAIAELSFSDGDTPKQFNSRLAVTGLKDIFGSEVEIENTQKRIAPASSLKGER